jgi:hypothetical protein
MAERFVRLVAVGLMPMITVVGRNWFDAHGEFAIAREPKRPGAAPVRVIG